MHWTHQGSEINDDDDDGGQDDPIALTTDGAPGAQKGKFVSKIKLQQNNHIYIVNGLGIKYGNGIS